MHIVYDKDIVTVHVIWVLQSLQQGPVWRLFRSNVWNNPAKHEAMTLKHVRPNRVTSVDLMISAARLQLLWGCHLEIWTMPTLTS